MQAYFSNLVEQIKSGLINGLASIILTLFVDPVAAIITDQAYRGERPETDLKALVVVLIGGKLAGTLLAQLLLVPGAWAIAWWYR
ncbi:hypothetical protein SY88_00810 [Clostridiales bacterium PH28_bin88]|nr:hypothetical protein SY88_00810 [Clostridiales bacterium PH28_bin88]